MSIWTARVIVAIIVLSILSVLAIGIYLLGMNVTILSVPQFVAGLVLTAIAAPLALFVFFLFRHPPSIM